MPGCRQQKHLVGSDASSQVRWDSPTAGLGTGLSLFGPCPPGLILLARVSFRDLVCWPG